MSDVPFDRILEIIQQDPGNRGLATVPGDNLFTACRDDLASACRSLAAPQQDNPTFVALFTGFPILGVDPPCEETDGPLGVLFLARVLRRLDFDVVTVGDGTAAPALRAGFQGCRSEKTVYVADPPREQDGEDDYWDQPDVFFEPHIGAMPPTHLIAIEKAGPSHDGTPYSMRGRDLTGWTSGVHKLFEAASRYGVKTIGIGDGGNEIGMGKIPREVIARNIPDGNRIACRVATDHLIVSGVSNWGAYGLGTALQLMLRGRLDRDLYDIDREYELLKLMVEKGPLVDGATGKRTPTVDGLGFDQYAEVLRQLGELG